jgi:hypothetical protein
MSSQKSSSGILRDPSCPSWLNLLSVPKKRRKKRFTATKAVKSMARTAIGTPRPVQREESRKRVKNQKHKPTLGKLLAETDAS